MNNDEDFDDANIKQKSMMMAETPDTPSEDFSFDSKEADEQNMIYLNQLAQQAQHNADLIMHIEH